MERRFAVTVTIGECFTIGDRTFQVTERKAGSRRRIMVREVATPKVDVDKETQAIQNHSRGVEN